jgi:hypothetical protein
MMIFGQNLQTPTKHSRIYGAKEFAGFWAKRAVLTPKLTPEGFSL